MRRAKDVDDVDRFRPVGQALVACLPENLWLAQVDRDDAVAVPPEVEPDEIARAELVRRSRGLAPLYSALKVPTPYAVPAALLIRLSGWSLPVAIGRPIEMLRLLGGGPLALPTTSNVMADSCL